MNIWVVMDDFLKSLTKFGCILFFLLIFVGGAGFLFFYFQKPEERPEVEIIETKPEVDKGDQFSSQIARTWTAQDGRQIEGHLVAATSEEALVRVIPAERVYRIPRERLSSDDQTFIDGWLKYNNENLPYPRLPESWPRSIDGRNSKVPMHETRDGTDYVWKTEHYEIRSPEEVKTEILDSLAMICESIEGAISGVPLPLTWARPSTEKRHIFLYPSRMAYLETGAQPNWGGHYDPETNEVHLVTEFLEDVDVRSFFGQYTLKKRNQYDLFVHEIIHQATLSVIASEAPAWTTEGVAEYFTALQNPPGRFNFADPQLAARRHITDSLQFDGLIEVKTLPMPHLSTFLYEDTGEFNENTLNARDGGFCYYAAALVLFEYFTHGDGNSMRPFLEALVSGADLESAVDAHLLRGRSIEEVEEALATYWKRNGLEFEFTIAPTLRISDLQGEVGLDSALSDFRRGL
ncbi:MAG: hypothetical protein CMO55_22255 [Verrucomicrobiales bacterium]|nr:hypothetical protein [Verrucomicrobiales bacterium]